VRVYKKTLDIENDDVGYCYEQTTTLLPEAIEVI